MIKIAIEIDEAEMKGFVGDYVLVQLKEKIKKEIDWTVFNVLKDTLNAEVRQILSSDELQERFAVLRQESAAMAVEHELRQLENRRRRAQRAAAKRANTS